MSGTNPQVDLRPEVSVIIPAYNVGRFLRSTVASVLAQTRPCLEIIIVNDGSKDDTWAVAQALESEDVRIIAISQANGGVSSARNHGFRASSGSFLAFLDSDDLWAPEFLEEAEKAFLNGADVFAAASHRFSDHPGDSTDFHGPDEHFVAKFPVSLIEGNPIVPAMVVIRRSVFEKTGLFEDDRGAWEDWDYWLRLAEGDARFSFDTSGRLVHYRVAPESRSSAAAVGHERCAGTLLKHESTPIAPATFVRRYRARWLRRRGNVEQNSSLARNFYRQSLSISPLEPKTWVKWMLSWIGAHGGS